MSITNRVSNKDSGSKQSNQACPASARLARPTHTCLALVVACLFAGSAVADPITVPNGDFSDPANSGSIGGLIGPNIVNQAIGSGPWHGTALGVAALLAQPTLAINHTSQTATISGLIGLNLGGLLNNGGYFQQQLPTTYQFGRLYILSADLSANTPLNLGLLGSSSVGVGLAANGNMIASNLITDPDMVDLQLVDATTYRLRFGHVADIAASGFIQLRLFNEPSDLLTANLLQSVAFSNVQLEGRDVGPASGIFAETTGDLLQAEVSTPFPTSLIAIVQDEDGTGVPGFMVRISAPLDGASAELNAPSSSDPPGPVITAISDLDGIVHFNAEANDIAGCYRVVVEAMDPKLTVEQGVFHLRNWSNDPTQDSVYCNGFQ